MERKRTIRRNEKTPRQRAAEKATREKFQAQRPALDELLAAGDYSPPRSQAEYFGLMELAATLKSLREHAGLSLAELAKKSGIDKAALSRLENGVADNPTLETLDRYLRALGKRIRIGYEDCATA